MKCIFCGTDLTTYLSWQGDFPDIDVYKLNDIQGLLCSYHCAESMQDFLQDEEGRLFNINTADNDDILYEQARHLEVF